MRRGQEEALWGTDGVLSLPTTAPTPLDTEMVDMEGFCFTPYGLRPNITEVDREELLRSGFAPPGVQEVERGS